jgi:hypothetical protein
MHVAIAEVVGEDDDDIGLVSRGWFLFGGDSQTGQYCEGEDR